MRKELGVSSKTMCDWAAFWSEVATLHNEQQTETWAGTWENTQTAKWFGMSPCSGERENTTEVHVCPREESGGYLGEWKCKEEK